MATQNKMTTQLEAVNIMLACVGEAPIETLIGNFPASVQIAIDQLRDTSREVQKSGWHFNTEDDFELTRALDGTVTLPGNILDVDLTLENGQVDLVQKGLRLYDKLNHTYIFGFNPHVSMITFFDWDDLNEPTRHYIKVKAARKYQDQSPGSDLLHQFTQQNELEAYADFLASDSRNEDATIFDSEDIASIVRRKRPIPRMF
jgi:hypothetical protein